MMVNILFLEMSFSFRTLQVTAAIIGYETMPFPFHQFRQLPKKGRTHALAPTDPLALHLSPLPPALRCGCGGRGHHRRLGSQHRRGKGRLCPSRRQRPHRALEWLFPRRWEDMEVCICGGGVRRHDGALSPPLAPPPARRLTLLPTPRHHGRAHHLHSAISRALRPALAVGSSWHRVRSSERLTSQPTLPPAPAAPRATGNLPGAEWGLVRFSLCQRMPRLR